MRRVIILLFLPIMLTAATIGWFLEPSSVSSKAKTAAISALREELGKLPKKGTLIIVDFSQASQTKRLEGINLETGRTVLYGRVAHGVNSGRAYATELSNTVGSLQSSAGLFLVGNSFNGRHGASLQLIGLDPQQNSNAERRGIIIHSASYVSLRSIIANWKDAFRLGRSQGCFVLSNNDFQQLEKNLVRPAYLYSYGRNSKH